jgi:dihydropteroate synthase
VTGPEGLPRTVAADRPLVMGVLNVTPDSFSDGGRWLDPAAAIEHGLAMAAAGADLIDVGGESTKPGAGRVPVEEELRRVVPVVAALAARGLALSIDTLRAPVAQAALDAGAVMVNDVSGGHSDPQMAGVVARAGAPFVAMHWRHPPAPDDGLLHAGTFEPYDDVVADVERELLRSVDVLVSAGVDPARIVLDPGLGFAKNAANNWALLAGLDRIVAQGLPVLIGPSRKRFLGTLLAGPSGEPVPVEERDAATAAVCALAAAAGVWCLRVHAVRATADAVRVASAFRAAQSSAISAASAVPTGGITR